MKRLFKTNLDKIEAILIGVIILWMATGFFENMKVIYDYIILLFVALCGVGYIIILIKKMLELGFAIIKDKIRVMLVCVYVYAIIHSVISSLLMFNS